MMRKSMFFLCFASLFFLASCQSANDHAPEELDTDEANNGEATEENADKIEGTLWGDKGEIGVVLSHGAAYDADSWKEQGEKLADEGMVVFATEDTTPDQLISAAQMLKEEHDVEKVSIIGASAGGDSTIDAVNEGDFDFNNVVLLSPAGDATEIDEIPVLVIYSEEEGFDDLENNKGSNIETNAIPGDAHAQELFDNDKTSEEVMNDIIQFIKSSP